jgi:N-acetylglucosaminyldiphosphoundecaprenol N-acetyl-beta-D-mannosaminyltransferase
MPSSSVSILGVRVDDVTYAECLERLTGALRSRQPELVTTPNPEIVMRAARDPSYRAVLNRATLNIPDGIGLVLAARLAGERLREHVQGTDLVMKLAAAAPGSRWFLLGGFGDVAARAGEALQRGYPAITVVGAAPGSPLADDDAETRRLLRSAAPVDVVLVAYGAPKQEEWLDRNLRALRIPVGIGVGGVFNDLAGDAPRAPAWLRQAHLEWLHRLITQPWRWRRQLVLTRFALLALAAGVRARMVRRRG